METPKTLASAIMYINPNFDGMDEYFTNNDEDFFASFCHSQLSGGIGMKIRNRFEFWSDKTTPLYLDLKNNHHCKDPDAMSDKIIRGVYKLRKNQTIMNNDNELKNDVFSNMLSKNQPDKVTSGDDYEKLKAAIQPMGTMPAQSDPNSVKMPSYIGTKVVCATPMDEVSFLRKYKNQPDNDNETRPGYLVVYEDGYKSWSPKETFERAYRLITQEEKRLI